ncbi:MAG: chemotaxis protein CheX [bacterium]|nr:chemotaxis protein CheX [bacterium]
MPDFISIFKKVSTKILEDWGMMLVDEEANAKAMFDPNQKYYVSVVAFKGHGTIDGNYSVICQSPFINALASNLLGVDDPLTEEQKADALKEMSNVLTGNLITEFYGADVSFDLLPPESFTMDPELAFTILDSKRTLAFCADDTPVAISFSLENPT